MENPPIHSSIHYSTLVTMTTWQQSLQSFTLTDFLIFRFLPSPDTFHTGWNASLQWLKISTASKRLSFLMKVTTKIWSRTVLQYFFNFSRHYRSVVLLTPWCSLQSGFKIYRLKSNLVWRLLIPFKSQFSEQNTNTTRKGSTFIHRRCSGPSHCVTALHLCGCFTADQLFSHPCNINHVKCWDNPTVELFMTAAYLSHFF